MSAPSPRPTAGREPALAELCARLWSAAGQRRAHPAGHTVPVSPALLVEALDQIRHLDTVLRTLRYQHELVRQENHAVSSANGGLMVEANGVRFRLAAALEIAEERGVLITDEEIAEQIAATRCVKEEDRG